MVEPVESAVPGASSPDANGGGSVDRRVAVRRFATALGLTAGAVALPSMVGVAEAKPSNPLIAGGTVDAASAQTAITANGSNATFRIENSSTRSGPAANAVDIVAPQVQLVGPVPSGNRPQVPDIAALRIGELGIAGGMAFLGADIDPAQITPVQIHSAAFSNYFQRIDLAQSVIFDSTVLSADARAGYKQGSFDATGRLSPSVPISVALSAIIDTTKLPGTAALCMSVTASGGDASGTIDVHDSDTAATRTSILTYTVLPAAICANGKPFAITATAGAIVGLDPQDTLWVSASSATHLKVAITGLMISDPAALVEPATPPAGRTALQQRAALQRQAVRDMIATMPAPTP